MNYKISVEHLSRTLTPPLQMHILNMKKMKKKLFRNFYCFIKNVINVSDVVGKIATVDLMLIIVIAH